jgi:hypothetical protein
MIFRTISLIMMFFFTAAVSNAESYAMQMVGKLRNPPDRSMNRYGRGTVNYYYRIADAPVSNADYAEFLNHTNKSGKENTYDERMAIKRSGKLGDYSYEAIRETAERPVTYVSFANAAEYCNYLSKGKVYDIIDGQVTRRKVSDPNSNEVFFIPTHNEWYKARYYKNGKYIYPAPLSVAEMVESRHRAWFRIAVGHDVNPEKYIVCNNYTNNVTGRSEDNVRLPNVGFRVASLPVAHVCPDLNKQNNYFYLNRTDLAVRLRMAEKVRAELILEIRDYWGRTLKRVEQQREFSAGIVDIPLKSDIENPGYYNLVVELKINGNHVQKDAIPFVVMDKRNTPKRSAESGFGLCIHIDRMLNCWGRMAPEDYIHILNASGTSWLRTDYPWEYAIEPFVGNGYHILSFFPFYNTYEKFDSPYKETELSRKWNKHGVPNELSTYAEECYKLVKNHPQVKFWEVGNEPHAWKISPYDYAQMCKVAYKAAKSADPSAQVILGDCNHIHKSVIAESGVINFFDAVAIHIYGFFKDYPEGIIGRMNSLRRQLARCGDATKPIWLTETSGCGYWKHIYPGNTLEERLTYQALDMPKKLAGSMAYGAEKVFIYEFMETVVNSTENEFGIIRSDFLPKPAFMAFRTTASQLSDCKFDRSIVLPDEFTGFLFKSNNRQTAIMWKEDHPSTLQRRGFLDIPMVKISSPELLTFEAEGEVFMVDVMGHKTNLQVSEGKVSIPVNEFPVFVTGNVKYKLLAPVKPDVVPLKPQEARVHILPSQNQIYGANDLHNFQHVVKIKLARETPQTIEIRVHNLTGEKLAGEAYLEAPGSNSDDGWLIKPVKHKLVIAPDSTATTSFEVLIGKRPYTGDGPYVLNVVFETAKGKYYHHVIVYQMLNKNKSIRSEKYSADKAFEDAIGIYPFQIKPDEKVKAEYSNLFDHKNVYNVRIGSDRKFIELFVKNHPIISKGGSLDGILSFDLYQIPGMKIVKVNLRLIDAQGEIFQFEKRGSVPVNQWVPFSFELARERPRGNWGANKNDKIDYPVKLRSIVIDFQGGSAEFCVNNIEYRLPDNQ